MYTQDVADLYTGQLAGGQPLFPVGTRFVFTNLATAFAPAVPLGFCCGGFSSTAGYVPGNEARSKSLETLCERLCYLKVDQFLKARLRFYPLSLKTSLATYLEAKPFGFSMGRE